MSTERGYTRINELVASLNAAMLDMEQGRLGAQGLERTTEDARELYERLVVLRHKVREARAALSAKAVEPPPVPAATEPEAPRPTRTEAVERPPMRLDTRPDLGLPPRQTSLIDAIAEHDEVPAVKLKVQEPEKPKGQEQAQVQAKPAEQEKPKAQAPAPAPAPAPSKGPSLAEKLEHAPIADLGKAITLSQKFLFLAELFSGQKEDYEKAINAINGHAGFAEAKQYLDAEVLTKLKKAPDPEALSSFMDLVERRFKGNA